MFMVCCLMFVVVTVITAVCCFLLLLVLVFAVCRLRFCGCRLRLHVVFVCCLRGACVVLLPLALRCVFLLSVAYCRAMLLLNRVHSLVFVVICCSVLCVVVCRILVLCCVISRDMCRFCCNCRCCCGLLLVVARWSVVVSGLALNWFVGCCWLRLKVVCYVMLFYMFAVCCLCSADSCSLFAVVAMLLNRVVTAVCTCTCVLCVTVVVGRW